MWRRDLIFGHAATRYWQNSDLWFDNKVILLLLSLIFAGIHDELAEGEQPKPGFNWVYQASTSLTRTRKHQPHSWRKLLSQSGIFSPGSENMPGVLQHLGTKKKMRSKYPIQMGVPSHYYSSDLVQLLDKIHSSARLPACLGSKCNPTDQMKMFSFESEACANNLTFRGALRHLWSESRNVGFCFAGTLRADEAKYRLGIIINRLRRRDVVIGESNEIGSELPEFPHVLEVVYFANGKCAK